MARSRMPRPRATRACSHELVLGHDSVHTSREALERGETEIRRIGRELGAENKQSYALRSFG